jgi:enoyl-CoA hydratase/carnithine racemase
MPQDSHMQTAHASAKITSGQLLARRDSGGIATLTLDSPASRNALSTAMLEALQDAFAAIAAESGIRAVVLTATGPVFCAGHDLKEISAARADADRGERFVAATMARCSALMQTILALPQPVVAAVEGVATAAGCQLVATCDLAVAGTAAQFCTPGVHIGLFCSTPAVALGRALSRKHAMEMLLTGEMVSAADAYRFGLVNRVVEAGTAGTEALGLAQLIATKSAATIRTGKQAFYRQIEMSTAEAYAHASRVMVDNMLMRDAEEGIGAFIEKRVPVWQDQ